MKKSLITLLFAIGTSSAFALPSGFYIAKQVFEKVLEQQDLADATSMLAQAYINTKSLDSALTQIKVAAKNTKKDFEKGRFNIIKGQLYNKLNYKDSANMAFDKVIKLNRKIPRKYLMAAHIEKAKLAQAKVQEFA